MITNDRKSAKIQKVTRKRIHTEVDGGTRTPVAPAPSLKRKANSSPTAGNADGETDSGVSSPVASTPATPTSQTEDMPGSPPIEHQEEDVVPCRCPVAESSSQAASGAHRSPHAHNGSVRFGFDMLQSLQHQQQELECRQEHSHGQIHQTGQLYDILSSDPTLLTAQLVPRINPMSSIQNDNTNQHPQQQQQQQLIHQDQQQPQHHQLQQYNYSSNPIQTTLARRRAIASPSCWQGDPNIYAKMQEKQSMEAAKANPNAPHLHRLIPSEGPIYGGSEVTVLGSNFYEGLTCLFGENPAVPTHCWSANTLLCILPPAATAGPVVVSFKEHPLVLEDQDVVLFTYLDETDRALMELALQVVGLKTMGKVEDARQIAMRIVQGDSNDKKSLGNVPFTNGYAVDYRHRLTSAAATAAYHNARMTYLLRLEEQVMAAIVAAGKANTSCQPDYISLMNRNRHTLLHLAALCGYIRLVRMLVKLGCDVNQVDHNGFTALHFASWTGKISIVKALVSKADVKVRNKCGKTAERLAQEAGHDKVARFLRNRTERRPDDASPRKSESPKISTFSAPSAPAGQRMQLSNILSSFYSLSLSVSCLQRLAYSVHQVYNIMFDPF